MILHRSITVLGCPPEPAPPPRKVAIVVNPRAWRASTALAELLRRSRLLGLGLPEVLATTPESPGRDQAARAAHRGADLVVAIGGDGTLREVATSLAGTAICLGIIALGSGNVLAYNLGILGHDLADQAAIALTGPRAGLDVGWASCDSAAPEAFLTMAGIGRDASAVARTRGRLKARLGPFAYGLAGLGEALRAAVPMRVQRDDEPARNLMTWTVLAGITPAAPGGILIHPDGLLDDGLLDVLEVPIRHPGQWLPVGWKGISHHRRPVPALRSRQAHRLFVQPAGPQPVQLDGDVFQRVHELRIDLAARALAVRIPPAKVMAAPRRPAG